MFGKSGHISRPDLCVDPVLTASQIVVRLQSIVTREVRPEEFAVIACASIHGRSTANIVPDFVDLKLSIRSYRPELHERLLAAVKRVVYAECEASGSLHIHEPTFATIMRAPATINDSKHAEILKRAFKSYFGDNTIDTDHFGASEDVSILATSCGAPLVHYRYGCVDGEKWEQAERLGKLDELPHNHRLLCTCDSADDKGGCGCVRIGSYDLLRETVIRIDHCFSRHDKTSFRYRRGSYKPSVTHIATP